MAARPTNKLTAEKALIFRIVHRDNVAWILDNGLHCRNSDLVDPNYVEIGNADLIDRRNSRVVPVAAGGSLSDYIPFYFTPFSPMLFNITTGWGDVRQWNNDEIVILVSSLHELKRHNIPFVFTDRHAYLQAANYFYDLSQLSLVDFGLLQTRDFKADPEDPGKMERYQAEALVYRSMPADTLLGILCYNDTIREFMQAETDSREKDLKIVSNPSWYF